MWRVLSRFRLRASTSTSTTRVLDTRETVRIDLQLIRRTNKRLSATQVICHCRHGEITLLSSQPRRPRSTATVGDSAQEIWWQRKGRLYAQRRPAGREGSIREIEPGVLRGIVKVKVAKVCCRYYLRERPIESNEYLLSLLFLPSLVHVLVVT